MSDPKRWRDEGAPAELSRLLARAPKTQPMTPAQRAQTADLMHAVVARSALGLASPWPWLASGVVGLAALILAVTLATRRQSTPTPSQPVPTTPTIVSPGSQPIVTAPSPAAPIVLAPATPAPVPRELPHPTPTRAATHDEAPSRGARVVAETPAAPPASTPLPTTPPAALSAPPPASNEPDPSARGPMTSPRLALQQESDEVHVASQLVASDPSAALDRIAAYRSQFPHGQMRIEAELVAIDALRRLGRNDEARMRVQSLLAEHPGTLYAARLQRILDALH